MLIAEISILNINFDVYGVPFKKKTSVHINVFYNARRNKCIQHLLKIK